MYCALYINYVLCVMYYALCINIYVYIYIYIYCIIHYVLFITHYVLIYILCIMHYILFIAHYVLELCILYNVLCIICVVVLLLRILQD